MDKKVKTYLLLAVVLLVWGVIGYKIVSTINPTKEKKNPTISQVTFTPKMRKEKDTFSLSLDYRDPFLGTLQRTSTPKTSKKKSTPKVTIPERVIKYTGFIANKTEKPTVFFVTIDDQQQMMSIKDVYQKIELVYGTKDKIKVRENGRLKTIQLVE